ncbi:hypothetical protein J6R97_03380 [bacterium]|nr:hypothetical protein [bacterium]
MSFELQNLRIETPKAGQTPISQASNSSNQPYIPLNGDGNEQNFETPVVKKNTNTETAQKRTAAELRNSVTSLLVPYGISLSSDEILGMLERVSGIKREGLLLVDQSEINKTIDCIKYALRELKKEGKEINATSVANLANKYNVALLGQWDSIENYIKYDNKHPKSSIMQRLKASGALTVDLDPSDPNYEAELKMAMERFFTWTIGDLNGLTQSEKEQKYKIQIQTFTRVLNNTPEGREKELLAKAIDTLYRTNIIKATEAGILSCETEDLKASFAKLINYEAAVTSESKAEKGKFMSSKEAEELKRLIFSHLNKDDIQAELLNMKEAAELFFKENGKLIAEIEKKNKEDLTEEELKILRIRDNLHIAGYSGAITGIVCNSHSSVTPCKVELLTQATSDVRLIEKNAGNNFYNDVMKSVSQYVHENQNNLTIPIDDFLKLLNEATDGNFTQIYNEFYPEDQILVDNNYLDNKSTNPEQVLVNNNNNNYNYYVTEENVTNTREAHPAVDNRTSKPKEKSIPTRHNSYFSPLAKSQTCQTKVQESTSKGNVFGQLIEAITSTLSELAIELYQNLSESSKQTALRFAPLNMFKDFISVTDTKTIAEIPRTFANDAKNTFLEALLQEKRAEIA